VHNSDLILSVAIVHSEVEGVADVCVSLPTLVTAKGAQLIAYPVLDKGESDALRRSAETVKTASDSVRAAAKSAPVPSA